MTTGYYYLHTNRNLLYKRALDDAQTADFRESDLVRMFWAFDIEDRESAWQVLIEAAALGAKPERIQELADLWMCDDVDALIYAKRAGCSVFMDGNQWCATARSFVDLQESTAGFGDTALAAMTDLCQRLGYVGGKTLGATYADLLRRASKDAEQIIAIREEERVEAARANGLPTGPRLSPAPPASITVGKAAPTPGPIPCSTSAARPSGGVRCGRRSRE